MEEEGLHGPRYAASVAQQSDHRRILCSLEQRILLRRIAARRSRRAVVRRSQFLSIV